MDPLIGASLIGAGASLGGGLMGNFLGGGTSEGLDRSEQRYMADFSMRMSERNEAFQNELARNGIRMRVADAEAAGIHPLAALGINPASGGFSAVMSGGSPQQKPSRDFHYISEMGQNIARAASAGQTQYERAMQDANLKRAQADADYATSNAILAQRQVVGAGKTPPIPTHISVMHPDGTTDTINNPDLAGAIMSDPLGMWGTSISNTIRDIRNSPKWQILENAKPTPLSMYTRRRRLQINPGRH